MNKTLIYARTIFSMSLIVALSILFTACPGPEPDPDDPNIPESLSGYILNLYDGSDIMVSAKHLTETSLTIENSSIVDYKEFAPFYGYKVKSGNTASYFMQFTRKLYLASTGYVYSMWTLDLTLTFDSPDLLSGSYSGTIQKTTGFEDVTEKVSGRFTLNSEYSKPSPEPDNVDFKYLTSGQWRHKYNDSWSNFSFIWKFNNDGTYTKIYDGSIETSIVEEGTYKKNTSNNSLSMSPSDGKAYTSTITYLDSKKMIIISGGEGKDAGVATEYTNEEYKPVQNVSVNISKPEISNITENSAIVKGTILGDVTFTKRGVCYSLTKNPTASDNVINVTSEVANVSLTNLFAGTTYYVRLFGVYNGQTYYGDETSFKTEGTQSKKIELRQTVWGPHAIRVEAKLPNNVGSYGLCWGDKPNPKITDNYVAEKNRETVWDFDVNTSTEFYVRAYHIDGSNVVYYEDSEIKAQTVRNKEGLPNIELKLNKFSKDYKGPSDRKRDSGYYFYNMQFTCQFANIPEGTYEVTFKDNTWTSIDRGSLKFANATKYSDGGIGTINFDFLNYSAYVMATDYIWIRFKDIASGDVYYNMWGVWPSGLLDQDTDAEHSHLGTWGKNIMKD